MVKQRPVKPLDVSSTLTFSAKLDQLHIRKGMMDIKIIENKTAQTRLTVVPSGEVRIKVAIDTSTEDKDITIEKLVCLAAKILKANPKNTSRGAVRGSSFKSVVMQQGARSRKGKEGHKVKFSL